MSAASPPPRRPRPGDLFRVGAAGLRARPTRTLLAALGIAIGVAALIAVMGVSASGRAELDARLDALGTDLLRVGPAENLLGERAVLPREAAAMIDRLPPVVSTVAVGRVEARVHRNEFVPEARGGGIAVLATDLDLHEAVGLETAAGRWPGPASAELPTVVLGSRAAERLGVGGDGVGQSVRIGGEPFTVIGVLSPLPSVPELETAALIGAPVARAVLGYDGELSTVYVRVHPGHVEEVREVLAAAAHPERPGEAAVSRPSEALEARRAVDGTLTVVFLALGGVALVVGGVGVANTMVVSVLERRTEIGLRRAPGPPEEIFAPSSSPRPRCWRYWDRREGSCWARVPPWSSRWSGVYRRPCLSGQSAPRWDLRW